MYLLVIDFMDSPYGIEYIVAFPRHEKPQLYFSQGINRIPEPEIRISNSHKKAQLLNSFEYYLFPQLEDILNFFEITYRISPFDIGSYLNCVFLERIPRQDFPSSCSIFKSRSIARLRLVHITTERDLITKTFMCSKKGWQFEWSRSLGFIECFDVSFAAHRI